MRFSRRYGVFGHFWGFSGFGPLFLGIFPIPGGRFLGVLEMVTTIPRSSINLPLPPLPPQPTPDRSPSSGDPKRSFMKNQEKNPKSQNPKNSGFWGGGGFLINTFLGVNEELPRTNGVFLGSFLGFLGFGGCSALFSLSSNFLQKRPQKRRGKKSSVFRVPESSFLGPPRTPIFWRFFLSEDPSKHFHPEYFIFSKI